MTNKYHLWIGAAVVGVGIAVGIMRCSTSEASLPAPTAVLSEEAVARASGLFERAAALVEQFASLSSPGIDMELRSMARDPVDASPRMIGAAGAAIEDAEWQTFPRGKSDLAVLFGVPGRRSLDIRGLVRHVRLNKADVYIAPEIRNVMSALIERFEATKDPLIEHRLAVGKEEMDALVSSGAARRAANLPAARDKDGIAIFRYNTRVLFGDRIPPEIRVKDGEVLYAYFDQMPRARQMHELYEIAMCRFVADFGHVFVSLGACDSREIDSILDEACRRLRREVEAMSASK